MIVVISLPEYEAGYMQYLKNLLSMQNQDEGKIIDSYVRQCVHESGNIVATKGASADRRFILD